MGLDRVKAEDVVQTNFFEGLYFTFKNHAKFLSYPYSFMFVLHKSNVLISKKKCGGFIAVFF